MPDFTSIDKPTVQERLSYWGRQVRKSMDNGNAFLPQNQHKAWLPNHIAVSIEFENAQNDARHGIHKNGEPLWTVSKDSIQGDIVTWDAAVDKDDEGDKLCYLLRLQELHDKDNDSIVERTPEQMKLSTEVGTAVNNCRATERWN